MIFVTVGATKPMPRLTKLVDEISTEINEKIVIQYGKGDYSPRNAESFPLCPPKEHEEYIKNANVVISHAGTGTVLQCVNNQIRLVLVPRRKKYGEHRNDHQIEQAHTWAKLLDVPIVDDVSELREIILGPRERIPVARRTHEKGIINELRDEIQSV